jgi:glutathione S-transferase
MSIQFYAFWRSIASFRVRVALRLKGLSCGEIAVDILAGERFKPGYDDVNTEHVVPTFVHDGHSIFQSLAITEHLDDIQPDWRHGRACPPSRMFPAWVFKQDATRHSRVAMHPRLSCGGLPKTWMPGTSLGMTKL